MLLDGQREAAPVVQSSMTQPDTAADRETPVVLCVTFFPVGFVGAHGVLRVVCGCC